MSCATPWSRTRRGHSPRARAGAVGAAHEPGSATRGATSAASRRSGCSAAISCGQSTTPRPRGARAADVGGDAGRHRVRKRRRAPAARHVLRGRRARARFPPGGLSRPEASCPTACRSLSMRRRLPRHRGDAPAAPSRGRRRCSGRTSTPHPTTPARSWPTTDRVMRQSHAQRSWRRRLRRATRRAGRGRVAQQRLVDNAPRVVDEPMLARALLRCAEVLVSRCADAESQSDYRYCLPIATRWMDNDVYGHVNNVVYYATSTPSSTAGSSRGRPRHPRRRRHRLVVESRAPIARARFPRRARAGLRVEHLGRRGPLRDRNLHAPTTTPPRKASSCTSSSIGSRARPWDPGSHPRRPGGDRRGGGTSSFGDGRGRECVGWRAGVAGHSVCRGVISW